MVNQGHIGESRAYSYLVEQGFTVFVTFLEGSRFDFIVYRDDVGLKTIQVKSCARVNRQNNWVVELRSRKDGDREVKKDCDIYIAAIISENKLLFFDTKSIKTKSHIPVKKDKLLRNEYCDNINELFG